MAVALDHLAGRTIAVFGLARSGLATIRAAVAGGATVVAWDDREQARTEAEALGARALPFADWPWRVLSDLVLAPGIPLTHPKPHPVAAAAHAAGVGIVCDIELLWREAEGKARFVAITGTNGKSTTTALLGHVLRSAGFEAEVGGNIGRAALDLEGPAPERVYVLEMSSYQLDLVHRFRPDVAVWLNLTPDHLDRHGDMAGYRRAKERIFANMATTDTAIVGIDEPVMLSVARTLRERNGPAVETVMVAPGEGAGEAAPGWRVDAGGRLFRGAEIAADFSDLATLRGAHNWQNAATAFAAARALGVAPDRIMAGMRTFPGLAHRMEIVARRGRTLFVNDSKATNADAAAKALATFRPIYWIAGGLAKSGGIDDLAPFFPRIAKAYLIGAAADAFSQTLARRVPHAIAGDVQTAVTMAAQDAAQDSSPEAAVLLSPACASFDQFADFEARGEAFRRAVASLDEDVIQEAV
ncbi:UDP-N-acetylmuramoyl-L-alanine--D-glutamate ligase [Propylenella binzhouense]|uniref:UDP-N-acetylmuramoylalanine--D-glutamate ligase n=1 Tax=Propylenella binzhouense TaxID=2555902 RepID=A0A964WTA4_9HYPH|nr:UDP-N-acetylmuramoyl-L-alanine--D-glutamate ligase [Propylenella binzhouense]